MEKLIIVHYINVEGMSKMKAEEYLHSLIKKHEHIEKENDILTYWIATNSGETRVECLNPKLVTQEEFEKAKIILDNINNL